MRALALAPLLAACLNGHDGSGLRQELVTHAQLDGETLHLSTEWSYGGERERGRHLTIALSEGTCILEGDEYDFGDPPKLPLEPIEHDIVATPHTIIHPVDAGLQLVFDDGRPRTQYRVAAGTRVRWVVDTTLILVERNALVDLETGRSMLIDGPEWALRFAIAQGHVFSMRDGQLVVTDLHLAPLPAPAPQLTLYDVGGQFGVGHVWQYALGDDVGWTHVRTDHVVALTGFRGVGPYATEVEWRSAGLIDLAVLPTGSYVRIDGVPYEGRWGELARIPGDLGAIVTADPRILVLANPEDRAVWVSVAGGPLRPFSYNQCVFAAR